MVYVYLYNVLARIDGVRCRRAVERISVLETKKKTIRTAIDRYNITAVVHETIAYAY